MVRSAVALLVLARFAFSAELPVVEEVALQPLKSQVKRVAAALGFLGEPLTDAQQAQLAAAETVGDLQKVLDPLCLVGVHVNPESRVKVERGPALAAVTEQGWRVFLVKVHNEAGVTARLRVRSASAAPPYRPSTGHPAPKPSVKPSDVAERWLNVTTFDNQPLNRALSGLEVEYRIVQLYARDRGKREATLAFDVGQGTQDLGFRNEVAVLFTCGPAVPVTLQVFDHDGTPTTGKFVIRDRRGRVYPARSHRLAPDFFFHDQVYRSSGETVRLPPGEYDVAYGRGPEYRTLRRKITVPAAKTHQETFRLQRWIRLVDHGWYSGDHHVHAAGCAHYEAPTQGVEPEVMMRHIRGEDLNIGCVLTWGPCWYFQKQFFEGKTNDFSKPPHIMRYDVEVSGFPSSHAGHVCLLRLEEDDYPGTERIKDWPSWTLPVMQWAKKQGGVVGFAHSGFGLAVPGNTLPIYQVPKFDGIGANEYIVDVVHGACDFISTVDTPATWELNIWYHTLNCGYRTRISGETDFPCIYGDRVGLGRSYVKIGKADRFDFDTWVRGLKDGRCYVSDGFSHLFDFRVNDLGVGEKGASGHASVLAVKGGEKLKIRVRVAAMLGMKPREGIRRRRLDQRPYWHVERARVGDSRKVPVELVVNGHAVARREIEADGTIHDLEFEHAPARSSWVALRVFPSAHTNPVFVEVDGKPVRASRRSADWCLRAVDQCWQSKRNRIRKPEREAAAAAYEVARKAYARIAEEAFDDRPR